MMRQLLVLVICALLIPIAAAQVYRIVDENGKVTYTDTPPQDSDVEEVKLPEIIGIPSTAKKPASKSVETKELDKPVAAEPDATGYRYLAIVSPENEATIPHHQRTVTVTGVTEPALHAGHKVRVILNGEPLAARRSLVHVFPVAVRGEYTVALQIVDADNLPILTTSPITLYVQRQSVK